jgi:hypothetical protein
MFWKIILGILSLLAGLSAVAFWPSKPKFDKDGHSLDGPQQPIGSYATLAFLVVPAMIVYPIWSLLRTIYRNLFGENESNQTEEMK